MGIVLASNFDVNTGLPLDSRFVTADLTSRDAIPSLVRWDGMFVYVESEERYFQLKGGITNSDWVEFGAGGGSGAGAIKIQFINPTATTLPSGGTSITIDGVSGADGDLVLFTNLSVGENKVYELSGVGSSILFTAVEAFDGSEDPTAGDAVRILKGATFGMQLAIFDGTEFKLNDAVRYFDGDTGHYYEQSSIKGMTLNNNATAEVFRVAAANSENIVLHYSILRGTRKKIGTLYITTDGTTATAVGPSGHVGAVEGVTFAAAISSGDLVLSATSDNSGSSSTIKFFTFRWADTALTGPSGLISYSGPALITTAMIQDGAVTPAKRSALGEQLSSSSGNFSTSSATLVDVTNLTVTITTTGRPVLVVVQGDGGGTGVGFSTFRISTNVNYMEMRILRGGTTINRHIFRKEGVTGDADIPPHLQFIETSLAAGTYTYTVQVLSSTGGSNVSVLNCRLLAFEL